MIERTKLLNLRVSDEELAKLHALADANDETMSQCVRRWIRAFHAQTFPAPMVPTRTRGSR